MRQFGGAFVVIHGCKTGFTDSKDSVPFLPDSFGFLQSLIWMGAVLAGREFFHWSSDVPPHQKAHVYRQRRHT